MRLEQTDWLRMYRAKRFLYWIGDCIGYSFDWVLTVVEKESEYEGMRGVLFVYCVSIPLLALAILFYLCIVAFVFVAKAVYWVLWEAALYNKCKNFFVNFFKS